MENTNSWTTGISMKDNNECFAARKCEVAVAAVVVNWNLAEETVGAVRSLQLQTKTCQIFVVDNGSSDDSLSVLSSQCSGAEIISLPENRGFASACNVAIARALEDKGCKHILLLNNDARIHPQAVSEMLLEAERLPQGGIIGPKIYYSEHPRRIWYAGARRRRIVLAAADVGRDQEENGQFGQTRSVDYVFGAAMLIHRRVFETIGLFDERFFLYIEDLDFCLRAKRAGFPLIFAPKALVWHKVSASTANDPYLRRYHLVKGTIMFLRKHASLISLIPIVFFWSLVLVQMVLNDFTRGNILDIRTYWSGLVSGLISDSGREGLLPKRAANLASSGLLPEKRDVYRREP